jgi:hypothetical protein
LSAPVLGRIEGQLISTERLGAAAFWRSEQAHARAAVVAARSALAAAEVRSAAADTNLALAMSEIAAVPTSMLPGARSGDKGKSKAK